MAISELALRHAPSSQNPLASDARQRAYSEQHFALRGTFADTGSGRLLRAVLLPRGYTFDDPGVSGWASPQDWAHRFEPTSPCTNDSLVDKHLRLSWNVTLAFRNPIFVGEEDRPWVGARPIA